MRRRPVQAALLLVLGLLILVGLLRSVHPAEVAAAIGHASLGPLVLGMLSALAFLGLRGWRWKLILDASAPNARVGDATAVTAVGFAVNAVAAFKVGEILRMAAIAPRAGIAVGEAGGTVHQQARRFFVDNHLRDQFLVHLILANLLSELLSLITIIHRRFARGTRDPQRTGGTIETRLIELPHADFETVPFFPEQVIGR